MKLTFRPATLDDLPTLLTLEQAIIDAERPFNRQIKDSDVYYYDLPALINNDNSHLMVCEQHESTQQQIVACGYVRLDPAKPAMRHQQQGYLGFMYVVESMRGQSINQQLMQRLIDWARTRGISEFCLDVYADNTAAIRAYEKMGFKPSFIQMVLEPE